MRFVSRGVIVFAVAALSACAAQAPKSSSAADNLSDIPRAPAPGSLAEAKNDNLNAVLWAQTAAEYDALAIQAYNQAARTLAVAKADPAFNALDANEQSPLAADAPLAIITDIDETVLDSSAFNADIIRNPIDDKLPPAEAHRLFDERWSAWTAQREAPPIAGAVAFLTQAAKDGVAIFYVTNRKDPERAETCKNLLQAGLPLADCTKSVLTRNDAEGRGKEKGSRRKAVGANHRVVVVLGDNLGDFADGIYASLGARDRIVSDHASWWGERWIMLPNPMYGSWEEVLGSDANDAISPTFSVELERRRLRKAQGLRAVDWWQNPLPEDTKTK